MKSRRQLEHARDTLGAMVDLGDGGPFSSEMRELIAAVHNCLCWVIEDGSPHAGLFAGNLQKLSQWCDHAGVKFIRPETEREQ